MRWGNPSSHLIGLPPATISPKTNIRMKTLSLKTTGPFLLLTFIYFIVGFLTTVNGQCQGPLKIAFLSEATTMRNSLTTLISFAICSTVRAQDECSTSLATSAHLSAR